MKEHQHKALLEDPSAHGPHAKCSVDERCHFYTNTNLKQACGLVQLWKHMGDKEWWRKAGISTWFPTLPQKAVARLRGWHEGLLEALSKDVASQQP